MKGQSRLFDEQAGDPSLRHAFAQSITLLRHEGLLQSRLNRSKGFADSWGYPLHECLILLERLLQSCVS